MDLSDKPTYVYLPCVEYFQAKLEVYENDFERRIGVWDTRMEMLQI